MGRKTPTVAERTSRRAKPRKALKTKSGRARKPSRPGTPVPTAVLAVQNEVEMTTETNDPKPEHSMNKRDLIDRVVAASGVKKKSAKPVVEAMLKELGDALARGDVLNLQPFGKANVKRHKELANADVIEVRLRRSKLAVQAAEDAAGEAAAPSDAIAETDPLADPDKEG